MTFPTFSDHPSISLEQNWKRELDYQYPRHMRLQPPSLSRKRPEITLNHLIGLLEKESEYLLSF